MGTGNLISALETLSEWKLDGKVLPLFKDFLYNFIRTESIFMYFSGNYVPFSVEYSHLHVPCTHWFFFFVNLALFGSKLTEPFINEQTHMHSYIQHSANYSKMLGHCRILTSTIVSLHCYALYSTSTHGKLCQALMQIHFTNHIFMIII